MSCHSQTNTRKAVILNKEVLFLGKETYNLFFLPIILGKGVIINLVVYAIYRDRLYQKGLEIPNSVG